MKKWEYLIVDWDGQYNTSINDEKIEPIEKGNSNLIFNIKSDIYPEWIESPSKILAYFGEQGWELVNVAIGRDSMGHVTKHREYTFKRPLP